CTMRFMPSLSAASCAPCCISMKNGLFSVLTTSAMVGFAPPEASVVDDGSLRLHEAKRATEARQRARRDVFMGIGLGFLSLESCVHQHRDNDHGANDDLLDERGYAKQVQAIAQH